MQAYAMRTNTEDMKVSLEQRRQSYEVHTARSRGRFLTHRGTWPPLHNHPGCFYKSSISALQRWCEFKHLIKHWIRHSPKD